MTDPYENSPGVKIAGRIYAALVAFGFAIICFICAANSGDEGDDVMCGGREMEAEDTCITYRNGSSTERDYDEQAEDNHSPFNQVAGVVGGIAAIAFGLFALIGPDPDSIPGARTSAGTRPSTTGRRPAALMTDAELVPRLAGLESGSNGPVMPMAFKGRDLEVLVDRFGVEAWSTTGPTGGLAGRSRRFRLEWREIKALEWERGETGAVVALIAVCGDDGKRKRLARLRTLGSVIEAYSEGRVILR
jgi:hypothetical protein